MGRINGGTEVHHAKSFLTDDGVIDWETFLDWDNLHTLCCEHHSLIHKYLNRTKEWNMPLYLEMFKIIERDGFISNEKLNKLKEEYKKDEDKEV